MRSGLTCIGTLRGSSGFSESGEGIEERGLASGLALLDHDEEVKRDFDGALELDLLHVKASFVARWRARPRERKSGTTGATRARSRAVRNRAELSMRANATDARGVSP